MDYDDGEEERATILKEPHGRLPRQEQLLGLGHGLRYT